MRGKTYAPPRKGRTARAKRDVFASKCAPAHMRRGKNAGVRPKIQPCSSLYKSCSSSSFASGGSWLSTQWRQGISSMIFTSPRSFSLSKYPPLYTSSQMQSPQNGTRETVDPLRKLFQPHNFPSPFGGALSFPTRNFLCPRPVRNGILRCPDPARGSSRPSARRGLCPAP